MAESKTDGIDPARLRVCLQVIAELDQLPVDHPDAERVRVATARLFKEVKLRRRRARLAETAAHDRAVFAATATAAPGRIDDETQGVALRAATVGASAGTLRKARPCYICKQLYREVDGLSLLSEALNFDFATKGMDEAFTREELDGMSGMQAMRDRVMRVTGRNPTVRDFLEVTRRGRPREAVVGSGKDVADHLEQWFEERACDGFVIAGTHTPGTFEDFVRFVVPELQRRGLYRKEYTGATLRENLGLPHPKRGDWRLPA